MRPTIEADVDASAPIDREAWPLIMERRYQTDTGLIDPALKRITVPARLASLVFGQKIGRNSTTVQRSEEIRPIIRLARKDPVAAFQVPPEEPSPCPIRE